MLALQTLNFLNKTTKVPKSFLDTTIFLGLKGENKCLVMNAELSQNADINSGRYGS